MNYYNKIAPLRYRLLALGLLLFFVIPPILKTLHSYEFHSAQKDCEHSATHLHSSSLHNDVLDYYFHFLAETNLAPIELFVPIIFHEKVDRDRASFYNLDIYFTTPRGPPVC